MEQLTKQLQLQLLLRLLLVFSFLNEADVKEGNTLTSAEATLLRDLAEDVKTSIVC